MKTIRAGLVSILIITAAAIMCWACGAQKAAEPGKDQPAAKPGQAVERPDVTAEQCEGYKFHLDRYIAANPDKLAAMTGGDSDTPVNKEVLAQAAESVGAPGGCADVYIKQGWRPTGAPEFASYASIRENTPVPEHNIQWRESPDAGVEPAQESTTDCEGFKPALVEFMVGHPEIIREIIDEYVPKTLADSMGSSAMLDPETELKMVRELLKGALVPVECAEVYIQENWKPPPDQIRELRERMKQEQAREINIENCVETLNRWNREHPEEAERLEADYSRIEDPMKRFMAGDDPEAEAELRRIMSSLIDEMVGLAVADQACVEIIVGNFIDQIKPDSSAPIEEP